MISLLYNVVSILLLLTFLSRLLEKLSPKLALSRAELLTIYVMLCLTTAIGGHMCVQMLVPIIGFAVSFATPENDWQALFFRYIPDWMVVKDKTVLNDFLYQFGPIYMLPKILAFILVLLAMSLLVA
jgi:hypothetical protein